MAKTHLTNNAIALTTLLLITALDWGYPYTLACFVPNDVDIKYIINARCFIAVLLCIVSGFLMKPVKRFSFLSTISAVIAIVMAFVAMIFFERQLRQLGGFGEVIACLMYNPITLGLIVCNPITSGLFGCSQVLFNLSPVYPSLLM